MKCQVPFSQRDLKRKNSNISKILSAAVVTGTSKIKCFLLSQKQDLIFHLTLKVPITTTENNMWNKQTDFLLLICSVHFEGLPFQGPVVQSVVSLTSSLRVIWLTVLADSMYNFLKFFAEKM